MESKPSGSARSAETEIVLVDVEVPARLARILEDGAMPTRIG